MRGFQKSGDTVFVADSLLHYVSKYSNCATKHFKLPSPVRDFDGFQEEILRIVDKYGINVLIPTCEEVFYISKMKKMLESRHVFVATSDFDILENLHNKYTFTTILPNCPKTFLIRTKEDLEKIEITKKYVLKPVFSRFGSNIYISKDFSDVDLNEKEWVLQEFIAGIQICTYAYCENGDLKFNICYNKIDKSTKATTVFRPYIDETLSKIISDFVAEIGYTGNISFDVIKSNGQYFFIECNPRVTSGVHTLTKNSFHDIFFTQSPNIILSNKKLLFATILYSPSLFFNSFFYRDVVFSTSDIKPFFMQLRCLFHMISIARAEKISLIDSTTFDIEYNGGQKCEF